MSTLRFVRSALLCALVLGAGAADATQYTNPVTVGASAYVDLGAGPLEVSINNAGVQLVVSDAQPAASALGANLSTSYGGAPPKLLYCQTSHVWAIAGPAPAVSAIVTVTPTSCGASGVAGTPTQASVSVTTSSGALLAAAAASNFVKVCIASSATNGIWVNWAGAAAVAAAPSEYIAPGQCDSWVKATGFLPTSQINAIAAATVAATVIYN